MGWLSEHPGFLFVLATLLPLGSFVALALAAAARVAFRPYRDSGGVGATLYQALGGDVPRRWPAYVATGAIGLAFVFSVIGFIFFKIDDIRAHEHAAEPAGRPRGPEEPAGLRGKQAGAIVAEAEREAIRKLRRDPKYSHPHHWAPFLLIAR